MKCTFSKKMFVFRNYYRMIYLVLAAILIAGIFVHPVVASVGFQATLDAVRKSPARVLRPIR